MLKIAENNMMSLKHILSTNECHAFWPVDH